MAELDHRGTAEGPQWCVEGKAVEISRRDGDGCGDS